MDIREDTVRQTEVAPPGGSIAASLNAPEPAPLDRFLWLLPLVTLMLLAGALAIYFLPTNLDPLWPLCFWLSLATALLVLVAWRMVPIITSPSNNIVRHGRNGKLIAWSPFSSLNTLLLVSMLLAALATGGMLSFALGYPPLYVVSSQVEQPFVLLVTSAVVIVLLLLVWCTPIRPVQKLLRLHFAGLGVLVIPVVIYLALNSWLPSLLGYPSDYTGPFASWPAMVQFAEHEAERIDKDAIIYDVSVLSPPHGPYSPQTSLFSMEFRFVRPTGGGIDISLLDTNPIRLVFVDTQSQALVSGYEGAHDRFADWFAYIKLGPQDVYNLTEKEAIVFAQRNGINAAEFEPSLDMSLQSSANWSSRLGVSAVWSVYYISGDSFKGLYLDVDAATGMVLGRNSSPSESTATPTPQPRATASPAP